MRMFSIRPLAADDLEAARRLWRATWTATYGPVVGPERAYLIEDALRDVKLRALMPPDGGRRGFCAELHGELLGTACFAERESVAYLWGMYVDPAHQRTGIGSALVRRVVDDIHKAEWIDLSVLTTSPGALAFYLRLGFARQGDREMEVFEGFRVPSIGMAAEVAALGGRARD
jgi:ribosomal protein S18 acetylase RimI-like enzyme